MPPPPFSRDDVRLPSRTRSVQEQKSADDLLVRYGQGLHRLNTRRVYQSALRQFFGGAPVTIEHVLEVTPSALVAHLEAMRPAYARTTIRNRYRALKSFCRWLRQECILDDDPTAAPMVQAWLREAGLLG